jgi:hypothetical protein
MPPNKRYFPVVAPRNLWRTCHNLRKLKGEFATHKNRAAGTFVSQIAKLTLRKRLSIIKTHAH